MAPIAGEFTKFIQFVKMEEKDGGQPTVWGVATWEEPDSDREVCDYETAVPVYQAWSSAAIKRTKKAGQAISMGPIRVQHGMTVGGKATKLEFKDDAKEIWLGSEPVNDEIHDQLKGGFLTGYSQGGSYAWRECDDCKSPMVMQQGNNFCDKCGKNVIVRYGLKRLAEVSYVDSPATGEGFESVKANGSCSIVKFQHKEPTVNKDTKTKRVAGVDLPSHCFAYVGDPEKTETWKLPIEFPGDDKKTKSHIRNALARFSATQGIPEGERDKVKAKIEAAARAHGIEVDGEKAFGLRGAAIIKAACEAKGVHKGLWDVSMFADILGGMGRVYENALFEREIEGDDSAVPDDLKELLEDMVEAFIAMATEEARELAARTQNKGDKPMTPDELQKAQEAEKAAKKSLASHFAKAASHHERMADMHEGLAAEHEKAAGHHETMGKASECKCGKAEKVAAAKADALAKGEVYKEDVGSGAEHDAIHSVLADQQTYHKAMVGCEMKKSAHHAKMAKAHDKHAEHLDGMADGLDGEQAKATKAECKTAYDAEVKLEKDAAPVIPPVPAAPTMDDDIKAAAAAERNSPAYKERIAAIGKAQVDAEVAKLAASTLAPLGIKIDEVTGQAILKDGIRAVVRDAPKDGEFAFAKTAPVENTAGL